MSAVVGAAAGMGVVMGVLNVTPDSFSDGGLFVDHAAAVGHGRRMLNEGAAIIDVGGESTRPGAIPIGEEEEAARVVSVVEELAAEPAVASGQARISIDTRHFAVARAAVAAGIDLLLDRMNRATFLATIEPTAMALAPRANNGAESRRIMSEVRSRPRPPVRQISPSGGLGGAAPQFKRRIKGPK